MSFQDKLAAALFAAALIAAAVLYVLAREQTARDRALAKDWSAQKQRIFSAYAVGDMNMTQCIEALNELDRVRWRARPLGERVLIRALWLLEIALTGRVRDVHSY